MFAMQLVTTIILSYGLNIFWKHCSLPIERKKKLTRSQTGLIWVDQLPFANMTKALYILSFSIQIYNLSQRNQKQTQCCKKLQAVAWMFTYTLFLLFSSQQRQFLINYANRVDEDLEANQSLIFFSREGTLYILRRLLLEDPVFCRYFTSCTLLMALKLTLSYSTIPLLKVSLTSHIMKRSKDTSVWSPEQTNKQQSGHPTFCLFPGSWSWWCHYTSSWSNPL